MGTRLRAYVKVFGHFLLGVHATVSGRGIVIVLVLAAALKLDLRIWAVADICLCFLDENLGVIIQLTKIVARIGNFAGGETC